MKSSSKSYFRIDEVNKTIELVAEYPDDEAPKKVTLILPYKDGTLALLEDLRNIDIGNLNLDGFAKKEELDKVNEKVIDLSDTMVDTINNQIINGIKVYNTPPRSNTPATSDDELVRFDQLKDLNSDFRYTNPEEMPETIGGLEAGTSFNNVPLKNVLDSLLYVYKEPSINILSLSKVEQPIYSFLPNINLTYNINNEKNIKPDTVEIYVNRVKYLSKQPSKGTVSINAPLGLNYYSTTITNIPVEVRCMSIKDKVISRSINLQFVLWCWTGCVDDPDITQSADPLTIITDNNFSIKYTNNLRQQFSFPQGGYKYVVFPNTWSNPVKFVDVATQFEVPMDYMGETVFDFAPDGNDGVNPVSRLTYKVFRSHNVLGGNITIKIQ